MLEPPESTICLYSSEGMLTAAVWIVSKSISVTPGCSMSTRCGWNKHSGASKQLRADFDHSAVGKLMIATNQTGRGK